MIKRLAAVNARLQVFGAVPLIYSRSAQIFVAVRDGLAETGASISHR
jgi:hypothetical protein